MKFVGPLITVDNIARSRDFYERVLNQKVIADFGENVTFEGNFSIHLRSHFQNLINNVDIKPRCNSFELYFENDKVEQLIDELNAYGVTYVHELKEQPWRQMVVRFYDPDGNMIEVGESLEHLSYRLHLEGMPMDKIASTTYMPEAAILEAIKRYSNS
jgi:catechol 2,3-dioxygenase-like lactoylglutathione lyase family enzyme